MDQEVDVSFTFNSFTLKCDQTSSCFFSRRQAFVTPMKPFILQSETKLKIFFLFRMWLVFPKLLSFALSIASPSCIRIMMRSFLKAISCRLSVLKTLLLHLVSVTVILIFQGTLLNRFTSVSEHWKLSLSLTYISVQRIKHHWMIHKFEVTLFLLCGAGMHSYWWLIDIYDLYTFNTLRLYGCMWNGKSWIIL